MNLNSTTSTSAIESASNAGMVRNVMLCYFAYCSLMAALYATCIAGGTWALFLANGDEADRIGSIFGITILIAISFPLCLLFAIGPFLPTKKWAWVYGLVLIAIGLTSPCCMPVSIPLLIYWIQPGFKSHFHD